MSKYLTKHTYTTTMNVGPVAQARVHTRTEPPLLYSSSTTCLLFAFFTKRQPLHTPEMDQPHYMGQVCCRAMYDGMMMLYYSVLYTTFVYVTVETVVSCPARSAHSHMCTTYCCCIGVIHVCMICMYNTRIYYIISHRQVENIRLQIQGENDPLLLYMRLVS